MNNWMPHGQCWLWDWRLILIHGLSDLLTFIAYTGIALVAYYIYLKGDLRGAKLAYPKLWFWGASFVLTCGISHLGNFLEIWVGGDFYWLTGVNKSLMSLASLRFLQIFWRRREDIALAGKVLAMVGSNQESNIANLNSDGSDDSSNRKS